MRSNLLLISMILVLALPGYAQDVLTEVQIPRPGIAGMVSNVAPGDLTTEQLFYALNMDGYSTPGILKRRVGLQYYGTSNTGFWGVSGYYDPYRRHKIVVGVDDSVYYQYFDSSGTTKSIPCLMGQFFVSDTFKTLANNGVGSYVFPTGDAHHDWTVHKDMLIHCDGRSLPIIFTTPDGSMRIASAADTVTYNPRVISMGLEAPGQLRVGITDLTGSRLGAYCYSYAWVDTVTDTTSPMAIPSAVVYPDNHYPYLTQFERPVCDSAFATLLILRQKQDGQAQWYVIDSLSLETTELTIKSVLFGFWGVQMTSQKNVKPDYTYAITLGPADQPDVTNTKTFSFDTTVSTMWLSQLATKFADTLSSGAGDFASWVMSDSLLFRAVGDQLSITTQDVCSTFYYSITGMYVAGTSYDEAIVPSERPLIYIDTVNDGDTVRPFVNPDSSTFPQPGQFWVGLVGDSLAPSTPHAGDDSIYWMAYSYYDPVTGMESPLGPTSHGKLCDSAGDSLTLASLQTGTPASGRPGWMRLYQGIKTAALYGGGDTTIWYGLYEMRTGDSANAIVWGNWTDVQVTTGLDTSTITVDTIYEYQVFTNISGDPIVRPPYNYDNQIPFSDIDKFGGRFWGIGDPVCPSCVYYSGYDTVWNWYMTDPFVLGSGVNDELVALEHLGNTLYAFKHNSIWAIRGSDVEYNLMFEQMTNATGAVKRETVVKHNDIVYFLSPELRVYELSGGGLKEISQPIEDRIDSIFKSSVVAAATWGADYQAAMDDARMFIFGDAVKLLNDSSGNMLSYHVPTGTWWPEYYTSYIPLGSFKYDSTEGLAGHGAGDILFNHSSGSFRHEYPHKYTVDYPSNFTYEAEMAVGGDGINLYTVDQIIFNVYPLSYNYLRYNVYNETGDSLCSSSYAMTTDSSGVYVWDVRPHTPCVYPRVKFWAKTGETYGAGGDPPAVNNEIEFEGFRFILRNHGRKDAR